MVHRENFNCSPYSLGNFSSFESLGFMINGKAPLLCVLIYRPTKSNSGFIQEFSDLSALIMPSFDRVLILGDFNIHVCCPSGSSFIMDFIHIVHSFNLAQSVEGPTHLKGHTLDMFCPLVLFLIASISVRIAFVCLTTRPLYLSPSFHFLLPQRLLMLPLVSSIQTPLTDFTMPLPLHL